MVMLKNLISVSSEGTFAVFQRLADDQFCSLNQCIVITVSMQDLPLISRGKKHAGSCSILLKLELTVIFAGTRLP